MSDMTPRPAEAQDVLAFWREAGAAGEWFAQNPAFDRRFRERFLDLHLAAARGACARWTESADGALALMILLDQYPRNAFRGTAHMYATDGLCRSYAREAEWRGHMAKVEPELRVFLALPFAHSEDMADQEMSIVLNGRLGEPSLSHAEGHRDIIRRFGRFPHRNAILGRVTRPEEEAFLRDGGFSG